jgi:hypothetical protein
MIFIKTELVPIGTDQLIRHLNRVLARVESSFTYYQGRVAGPIRAPGDEELFRYLNQAVQEDAKAASGLRELIVNLNGVPEDGCFPISYSTYNYLTLRYLAPHLARSRKEDALSIFPELEISREHPSALEILTQLHPRWEQEAAQWEKWSTASDTAHRQS